MPSPEPVADFRARYRAVHIGPRYSGWAHFAFTTVGALVAIAVAAAYVRDVAPAEWLVVPLSFLVANVGEYLGHRGPMHHARRGLRLLFNRHTLQHHRFFTHEVMGCESSRDYKMVLFPPVMLVFFLGGLALPVGALLYVLVSPNAGLLFATVGVGYFLTYEWLHFAYHLPPGSWVKRLPFMDRLEQHHRRHHDPRLMGRWNFNITFPVADRLFGTLYRELPAERPRR